LTGQGRAEMVRPAFMPARPDGPLRGFAQPRRQEHWWEDQPLQSLLSMSLGGTRSRGGEAISG